MKHYTCKGCGKTFEGESRKCRTRKYCSLDCLGKSRKKPEVEDHYSVYYLPKEHYVGTTKNLRQRMKMHRREDRSGKRNTDGWRVLYCSENKIEAYYHEALFQSVLGIGGLEIKGGL